MNTKRYNTSNRSLNILTEARHLITEFKHWTQFANSRDAAGDSCSPWDNRAVCWCALGAITKIVADHPEGQILDERWSILQEAGIASHITSINDSDGHSAILTLFDKGIATLKKKGQEVT